MYTTDKDGHLYVMLDSANSGETVLTLPNVQVDASVPAVGAVAMLGRTDGLKWALNEGTLEAHSSRGVSNELVATTATISLAHGQLFVIQPNALEA
jgi:thiamine pyrophosphokinase